MAKQTRKAGKGAGSSRTGMPKTPGRSAYGTERPICMNTACVLRKKAKCFGFEGCPGFQAK